jgi:hypothetical protein
MGWNYPYFTDNQDHSYGGDRPIDDTLDWFPGVSAVYFRVGWSRIEAEEGKYTWEYTDRIAEQWISKGKQVAYCWIVFSTAGTTPATPDWLRRSGATGWTFPLTDDKPIPQWVPNWDDPVFLDKFGVFLAEAARRYDGNPSVQFIEVGSLGTWGEGHNATGISGTHVPEITIEAQKKHVDLWRKHFKKSTLLVNDDFDAPNGSPGGANPERHPAAVEYAFSKGMGMADWSIMVQDARPYMSAWLAQPMWPTVPIGLENEHYGLAYLHTKSWHDGGAYLQAMERYHASFLRIHWWPGQFLNGNDRDLPGNYQLVKEMNKRVGYRLQPVEASWPSQMKISEGASAAIKWRNAGVAPCYGGGHPALSLVDDEGKVQGTFVARDFDVEHLGVGPSEDQAPVSESRIIIPPHLQIAPSVYTVCVSVGDEQGKPIYRLPVSEYDIQKRYRLGEIILVS